MNPRTPILLIQFPNQISQQMILEPRSYRLGRDKDNDIVLAGELVSGIMACWNFTGKFGNTLT